MKYIRYYILIPVFALLLSGCFKNMQDQDIISGNRSVVLSLDMPKELDKLDRSDFKVEMYNTDQGISYVTKTDKDGNAAIDAEYGNYSIIISKKVDVNGVNSFLHAISSLALGYDSDAVVKCKLAVKATVRGSIIIKEVYFQGTKTPDGSSNYVFDQYLLLYNNSDEVQYLDGLGVGVHADFNSNNIVKYNKYWIEGSMELRDSIPINAFGLMFPGKGDEHPLNPGEEIVVALSAINHDAGKTSIPMNLASENSWSMFVDRFVSGTTQKAPEVGVKRMECFCELAMGTSIVISRLSPALVLYRLDNPYGYVAEGAIKGRPYGHVMLQPPKYVSMPAIMIPGDCIIDGVEFKNNETHVPRLISAISLQPLFISSTIFSGTSYTRKKDVSASELIGRTVYQDTNNSAQDWMSINQPTITSKNR